MELNQNKNMASFSIHNLLQQSNDTVVPNYLFTKISTIKEQLVKRISLFKEKYFAKYLQKEESFINDNDNFSKTEEVKMVGRIVSTEKGFLNSTNVRIELN